MSRDDHAPPSEDARRAGFETADAPAGRVLAAAAGLVALVLGAAVGSALLVEWTGFHAEPPGEPSLAWPPPGLSADPPGDLAAHRRSEDIRLNAVGWVDRRAGIARIPIEEAMRLLARQGWPAADGPGRRQ